MTGHDLGKLVVKGPHPLPGAEAREAREVHPYFLLRWGSSRRSW